MKPKSAKMSGKGFHCRLAYNVVVGMAKIRIRQDKLQNWKSYTETLDSTDACFVKEVLL